MAVRRKPFAYTHPRPAVTVDIVLFRLRTERLETLLIERGNEPHAGRWAFPGGFLDVGDDPHAQGEELHEAAERELEEETQLPRGSVALMPFGVFGKAGRDPRGRTITVAYTALLPARFAHRARAGDDAAQTSWVPVDDALARPLAFDHDDMLRLALDDLERRVWGADALRAVLPGVFSAREFRRAAEHVLGGRFDGERHRLGWQRLKRDGVVRSRAANAFTFRANANLSRRGRRPGRGGDPLPGCGAF
ncbi:MAG: NUDIX hydrolase [Planctomycetes bacterium]|nr:NUDIX hydrolase [Planctomycetota bacterium]